VGRLSRPLLSTERLRLEPLTVAHTDLLVGLDSDPEVLRFVFGRALSREEAVTTWMPRRTRPEADARGLGYWVGHDQDEFMGWWCLGLDDEDPGAAELGYRLRRTAWGRGYATDGARALVDHAFGTVGLDRVWATTMTVNEGSRRVLTKVGLRHVRTETPGPQDPDRAVAGWEQGVAVFELTREEWASSAS
jgi:RimJ/RimL family protein N-acetyltransferase